MKKRNPLSRLSSNQVWERFFDNKAAVCGLVIMSLIVIMAIFAGNIFDYENQVIKQNIAIRLQKPSAEHWFGTDDFGRDILARVVYGSRASLSIAFSSVVISVLGGVLLGALAGFYGGITEGIIMRITDIFMAIPQMLMSIMMVAVFGSSRITIAFALGIASIPKYIRITRGAVLTVRQQEYIESARAIGSPNSLTIIRHIIPNCFSQILVQIPLSVAISILSVSGLSYLGMGIPAPMPEWGSMLSGSRAYLRGHSYMAIFPGLAIMITILALNLMGDGLRDATDPKLK
ncbi:MAG: ABC transporter permease [Spirochaetales bacterium]|nr:ABC transporter permease [Spirochaetales bacterium]